MHIDNYHVALYSWQQKYFHIETVAEMLNSNVKGAVGLGVRQYHPIAIFQTYEECDAFIKAVKPILEGMNAGIGQRPELSDLTIEQLLNGS